LKKIVKTKKFWIVVALLATGAGFAALGDKQSALKVLNIILTVIGCG
jgi:hypothetical protein